MKNKLPFSFLLYINYSSVELGIEIAYGLFAFHIIHWHIGFCCGETLSDLRKELNED